MIPKQIHFVWTGPAMPWWAEANVRRFGELNPDFVIRIHGESVLLEAFRHAYGRINGEHLHSRRSDLIRLSALIRHGGGWYFDCDFLPVRPLDDLYIRYAGFPRGCFVTHCDYLHGRPWMANGVIGTGPLSPFFSLFVAGIVQRGDCLPDVQWGSYGPDLMTPLVEQHPDLVHVGQIGDFYRFTDREKAMGAYRRIADAGYSRQAIADELGEPLPYMLHMGMQDELNL